MPSTVMLSAHDVSKQFELASETVTALREVSYDFHEGDFVAVMGPSGSGKTTWLNLLSGLEKPSGGSIEFRGRDINQMSERERTGLRAREFGFVFQDAGLMSGLDALGNVRLPQMLSGQGTGVVRARRLLHQMGLAEKQHRRPVQMSRGEKQRVAIARALANHPSLLLADEPTGNLDRAATQQVFKILRKLSDEMGLTVVVATHDESICQFARNRLTLANGQLSAESIE